MKRTPQIVSIGQGLCRLTVRSEKQRDLYAKLPGVRIDDRDAEHLGYRVIFPERMKGLIQSTLEKEGERAERTPQPVQIKLTLPEKQKGGDKPKISLLKVLCSTNTKGNCKKQLPLWLLLTIIAAPFSCWPII